jgi:hypothetical protein
MRIIRTFLVSIAVIFFTACADTQSQESEGYGENRVDPRKICSKYKYKSDMSVKCYEKVAHDNPNSPDAHYFLAVTYIWVGDKNSTLKEYKILKDMGSDYTILLIDVIEKVQPEWFDRYYQEELKRRVR